MLFRRARHRESIGKLRIASLAAILSAAAFIVGCAPKADEGPATEPSAMVDPYAPAPYVKIRHPEWTRDATIYQINTRQFTEEGTFAAAEAGTAAPQRTGRANRLVDAHSSDWRAKPKRNARQSLFGERLLWRQSGVRRA